MFFQRPSASAAPAASSPAPATPAVASGEVSSPAGGSRGLILIVDDSSMIRTAVAKTLISQGYEIIEADDGVNGLAVWEENKDRITMVLSDVFMPRKDGLTMARELRQRSRALPVALMSSKLDDNSRWMVEEAGFRLLPKPFKDSYLLELVARMIRMRTS